MNDWCDLLRELQDADKRGAFATACDGASRLNMARSLEARGYARWCGTNWGSNFYAITDAGRAALPDADGGPQ